MGGKDGPPKWRVIGFFSVHIPALKVSGFSRKFPRKLEHEVPKSFHQLVTAIPYHRAGIQDVIFNSVTKSAPVVLLQDIHLNPEAQTNLSHVLESLIQAGNIDRVGIEGAFEPFDFSELRAFPNKKVTREAMQALVDGNLLAAPSFAGITSEKSPPLIFGIDDREHYQANVNAYLQTRSLLPKVEKTLSLKKAELRQAKQRAFGSELLKLDRLFEAYHSGSLPMHEYLTSIRHPGDTVDLVVEQFLEATALEKSLDYARVEIQRTRVLTALSEQLRPEEMAHLLNLSVAYREGKLGFASYYQHLKQLCIKHQVALSSAPAFDSYIQYVLLSDGIQPQKLLKR